MRTCDNTFHWLLLKILAVICASLYGTLASATEYAPISVSMEVKKVSEHVYYVQGKAGIATDNEGFISNAGFIVTGDGVVVFDTLGTPSLGAQPVQNLPPTGDDIRQR